MASIRTRRRTDGGKSYEIRWRLGGTADGAEQSETIRDDRMAARNFAQDVEDADHRWPAGWVKGVGYATAPPESATQPQPHLLADFGCEFVAQRTGVGPDTRSAYAGQVTRLVGWLTAIRGMPPTVEDITADDIRRLVNAREAAGAKPKTISNYHGLLSAIMEYAIERELRTKNPCRGARLPQPSGIDDEDGGETITFLTEAEFELVRSCLAFDPAAQDLVTVVVGTGLRWGEASALQVRDLELDGPVPRIRVRRAWKYNGRGDYARACGRRYLGKPKSRAGKRWITCSPTVVDVLRRITAGKAPTDFIFTATRGGPLNHTHFNERRWRKAVEAARAKGLFKKPRFHDLRHTHAAWLISAGVPLPVIQKRLGHESIKTTVDVYGGLLNQAHEAADAAIEAALSGGQVPVPLANRRNNRPARSARKDTTTEGTAHAEPDLNDAA